ncbi:MAG: hypothetical protein ACREH8_16145 [Opitutaceae bacterium]
MARFTHVKLLAVSFGVAAFQPVVFAQTPVRPAAPPALSPVEAEKAPPPATSKRTRAVSPGVAAALAAASPKYTPPPKAEPKREEELPDMREIDKPKNAIVRLPKYIVQEPKSPVFTERSIHTEKGLTEIAMRRYVSDVDRALNRFTLPLFGTSKEARALAMYAEDERLRNMSELEDTATAVSAADAAAGTYIRRESEKTFMRSSDFGWTSGPPK